NHIAAAYFSEHGRSQVDLHAKSGQGIRSWDVDLQRCNLDQQLQLFITRHSAHFSSEVRGQCNIKDQWRHRIMSAVSSEKIFDAEFLLTEV
uniref:Microtubule-associated protein 1B/S N-terminal domain-containing protein n=1 Tax=Echeneis naucrates TaxID=173247 RepID=A0A665ULI4_ECHNA